MGSGLVGLYMKGVLTGKSFPVSRNWLTLGEAVSLESARPQMSKFQKYQK